MPVCAVIFSGEDEVPILLKNVLFVPGLKRRLLLISAFTESGATVIFQGSLCTIIVNDKKYELGHKHGKLWKLNNVATCCSVVSSSVASLSSRDVNSLSLWHQKFDHLNKSFRTLQSEKLVDGISVVDLKAGDETCKGCVLGKTTRFPFLKAGSKKSTDVLDR